VKNGGSSCQNASYAFATIESIESAKFITSGKLIVLSVQQVIDCTSRYDGHGCLDGSATGAYTYLLQAGVASDQKYPFSGAQKSCTYNVAEKEV
jgi:hypothetical protein